MEIRPGSTKVIFHAAVISVQSLISLAFIATILKAVVFHYQDAVSSFLPKDRWMFFLYIGATLTFLLPGLGCAAVFNLAYALFLLRLRESTILLQQDVTIRSKDRIVMRIPLRQVKATRWRIYFRPAERRLFGWQGTSLSRLLFRAVEYDKFVAAIRKAEHDISSGNDTATQLENNS